MKFYYVNRAELILKIVRIRLGYFVASLATLDLRLAVHRGSKDRAAVRVLHPIHRDEPLHHLRHGHRRVLCSCHDNDNSVLADLEGDEETAEGSAEFAGRQARREQAQQLEVVTNAFNCFSLRNLSSARHQKKKKKKENKRNRNPCTREMVTHCFTMEDQPPPFPPSLDLM